MTGPRLMIPAFALAASAAAAATFGALSLGGSAATGSVEIRTEPPGASVFVDGVFRGVSPVTIPDLGARTHALRIEKADFDTLLARLTARERQPGKVFGLTRTPRGALEVASSPPGAEVFVDGRYRGVTPLTLEGLRTGPRQLSVEKPNHHPWTGTALVSDGRATEVSCELADRVLEYLQRTLADAPGEVLRYMELGHYYYILGDVQNSTDVYRRGLILAEDRMAELQHEMIEASGRNDRNEAERLKKKYARAKVEKKRLDKQIRTDSKSGSHKFRVAMEEVRREVRTRFPRSVAVALKEADAAEQRGELKRAVEIVERALRILPGSARLWERLASCRARLGRYQELRDALRRTFKYSGTDAGVRVRLTGVCLDNAGRFEAGARRKLFEILADELARAKQRGDKDQQKLHALMEYRANREAGRVDKAVRALRESLRNTDDAGAIEKLKAEARRWLEDVAENSPDKSAAALAKAELERF